MASSPQHRDAGYMTAAAALISLAIAVIASAFLVLSLTELRRSRAALERIQVAAMLDGGHLIAALTILSNARPGRARWRETTAIGTFDILAEPERDKVNASAMLDPALLLQLGAKDPTATANWLTSQAMTAHPKAVSDAETAGLWKACAPSLISYFGRSETPKLLAAHEPDRQGRRAEAGQVWRVRVGARGWVDDRLVRMTGEERRAALTITRTFGRDKSEGEPCGAFIQLQ